MEDQRQIATIELKDKEDYATCAYLVSVLRSHGMNLILPIDGKLNIVVSRDKFAEIHSDF